MKCETSKICQMKCHYMFSLGCGNSPSLLLISFATMFPKFSNNIISNAQLRRASVNTKYHCSYGYYFLGLSRARLSVIYRKSKTTISSWIHEYEENGLLTEAQRTRAFRKFNAEHRNWIVKLYLSNPVLFLDECCELFLQRFNTAISAGSVCRILHAEGLTWKALERRAIQVREDQIFHFFSELSSIEWDLYHLVFLDEVSLDSNATQSRLWCKKQENHFSG